MANSKKMLCFYCNKKSNLRYDGQTEWTCSTCEAVNYLDENGDITDPPVATLEPAPSGLRFSAYRSEPATLISDSNPFCETCLKNQHLYTSSLQQYHLETDPIHPHYRESEKLYYKYVKTLNQTYPQVCADCLPRVNERLNAATKTAKSDFIRRMLDRTRERRAAAKSYSLFDLFLLIARWLWYIGIVGQLLWNIMALLDTAEVKQSATQLSPYLGMAIELAQPLITAATSSSWARYSFRCTLATIWWNPKFKELNNGFMNHIIGFSDWYKFQLIHLIIRSMFIYTMGSGVFSDPNSPATVGAHLMVPLFVLFLSIKSKRALKVDMTPLWKSTPEKIRYVGPGSGSPSPQNMGGMASILDEIAATPSDKLSQPSPPPSYILSQGKPSQQQSSYDRPTTPSGIFSTPNTIPQFRKIPQSSGSNNMSMGGPYYQQQNPGVEEMEWTPDVPQTQARAFKPTQPQQPKPNSLGECKQPSPFYGRLPEAPITPAHRLRNPPNQPRLRVSSQEVKENFFNNITKRAQDPSPTTGSPGESSKREMNLAQQRFFPPTPPSEAGNVLADLLTSFSLSAPEDTPAITAQCSTRTRHMWQALVLILGLFFWNHSASLEEGKAVMLTVMICCLALGVRTLLDNTVFIQPGKREAVIWHTLGTCIGGLELMGAGFGLCEILASRGDHENCNSLGTVLIGSMLIHEIWLALFGR